MGTISKLNLDGTSHLIASSAYGWCTDSPTTANKTVTMQTNQTFQLVNGATVHVYFTYQNTASNPTLNVDGTGAKPIYAFSYDGTNTVKPIWPARAMISFTYNASAVSGGCWSMNDPVNGRAGTYEIAYNTTVDTDEVKDAYYSKKQIVLKKAGTNSEASASLINYEYDSNGTPTGLVFAEPAQGSIIIYIWNGLWSTATHYLAPESHASTSSTYGLGSDSNYGHVKLSNSTSSTSGTSDGVAATPSAVKAVADAKAPTSHASTTTTYGKGTSSNYGHVKLSDSVSSTSSAASSGVAATPSAVKTAYDLASAVQTALDQTSFVQVTVPNGSKTITFPASVGTRGVLFMDGYSNGTKAVYMLTCSTSGTVATVSVLTGSNYTLTTGTRTLTIANNSTASTGYGVLMLFAGSATVS